MSSRKSLISRLDFICRSMNPFSCFSNKDGTGRIDPLFRTVATAKTMVPFLGNLNDGRRLVFGGIPRPLFVVIGEMDSNRSMD